MYYLNQFMYHFCICLIGPANKKSHLILKLFSHQKFLQKYYSIVF